MSWKTEGAYEKNKNKKNKTKQNKKKSKPAMKIGLTLT